jgi:hypothetical protein
MQHKILPLFFQSPFSGLRNGSAGIMKISLVSTPFQWLWALHGVYSYS